MGCTGSKDGAVILNHHHHQKEDQENRSPVETNNGKKSTGVPPSKPTTQTKAAYRPPEQQNTIVKLDEVANASDSDWGELINEMDAIEPLQNAKRRRLSISTVHGPMEVQEATGAQAERRMSALTSQGRKTNLQRASSLQVIPGMTTKPTEIVRTEASKLLQNGRANIEISDVDQIKELFPKSVFFGVFGDTTDENQGGFDNKTHGLIGSMPPGLLLQNVGVGYSCRKGLKPESPNQDDFFVLRVDDWSMYGVFDGHGPYGHSVSGFVHRTLPYLVVSDPVFFTDLPKCLRRAFHKCNALCAIASDRIEQTYPQEDERYWDCLLSGTTCTIAVARKNTITIAHVGDSRVVAGSMSSNGIKKLEVHELSHDHKPQDPKEWKRIHDSGGEVRKLDGDIPHRVFCRNRQYPGLAMSRALGDALAQSIGVTCDPDITVYERCKDDLFIVLASDGVWEFMDNREVVDIVHSKGFDGCQKAADAISIESWKRWLQEEGNVVDDITCVVVWSEQHMKK